MFKRLRNKIEENRDSKEFFWRSLVFLKDFVWGCYERFRDYNLYLKNKSILKNLIKDKRILIVGSGSSVNELDLGKIPEDVRIFTCKTTPRLFIRKNCDRRIDLYFTYALKMKIDPLSKELVKKIKSEIFVIDDLNYLKKLKKLSGDYPKLIKDYNKNNYYLERLIKPYKIRQIKGKLNSVTSSGMRLLQYALYFKAKEVYLIGIDISEGGYFWGAKNIHEHMDIDRNFIKIVSKKYSNIYSLSKKSPITKYIKYKPLFSKNIKNISEEKLIEQYKLLHNTRKYGDSSIKLLEDILPIVLKLKPRTILDYGCGQSKLIDKLKYNKNVKIYKYDPAIGKYNKLIEGKVDLVINTDVLEHIPEKSLSKTIGKIKSKSENIIFCISCVKANIYLPNGINCHITIKPKKWWIKFLKKHFKTVKIIPHDSEREEFLCKTF